MGAGVWVRMAWKPAHTVSPYPRSMKGWGHQICVWEILQHSVEILFTLQAKLGKYGSSQPPFFSWLFCAKHQGTSKDEEKHLHLAGETGRCISDVMYLFVPSTRVGGPLFLFEAFIECQVLS